MTSPCIVCTGSGLAFNTYIPRKISKMKGDDRWRILYQRVDCGACNGSGVQIEDSYLDNMLLHYGSFQTRKSQQQNREKVQGDPQQVCDAKNKNQSWRRFGIFKKKKEDPKGKRRLKNWTSSSTSTCTDHSHIRRGRDRTPREISFKKCEEIQSEVTMSTLTQMKREPMEFLSGRGRSRTVYDRRR